MFHNSPPKRVIIYISENNRLKRKNERGYVMLEKIIQYVRMEMNGISHGFEHVVRVAQHAKNIAQEYDAVNLRVLIYAAFLHDIGRKEQTEDSRLDHAEVGANKAHIFLSQLNMEPEIIQQIEEAIRTHRYRVQRAPESLEARILYDADKLDAIGVIGAFRAIAYAIEHGEPIFMPFEKALEQGVHSANVEYEIKLRKIPEALLTETAFKMAKISIQEMENIFKYLEKVYDNEVLLGIYTKRGGLRE
jgi:uncharacterized protein